MAEETTTTTTTTTTTATTTTTTAAAPTTKELLDDARRGLQKIFIAGQSYTLDGRTFTRANASDLIKIISQLQRLYNIESGTFKTVQQIDFSNTGY